MTIDPGGRYTATLATSDGVIGVELLPKVAPNAVNNFIFLAEQGFYERVPIHRMLPGFMFQSGDPTGTGMGGPGYDLPDDPVPASMRYDKGVLAMANTGMPNSGGSQFFIMLDDYPLPPTYTIFGKVTSGTDVLDRIAKRPVTENDSGEPSKPVDPIGIYDITIKRE
jgi:cyclophilin family peptidyl-prolyl cis-trans isomerase